MEIEIKFLGGPVNGQMAMTDGLDPLKVFFDDRERLVLVYARENETEYVYDLVKSHGLTAKYDEAKAKIMGKEPSSLRFFDVPESEGADDASA